MAIGAAAGLELLDALAASRPSGLTTCRRARADLLARLGRTRVARLEFGRAAALAGNARDRDLLRARAEGCR